MHQPFRPHSPSPACFEALEGRVLFSNITITVGFGGPPILVIGSPPATVVPSQPATSFLSQLSGIPTFTVFTTPVNNDTNPHGVAIVPRGFPPGGVLSPGDTLVSNFNNSQNLPGTGQTIMRVDQSGQEQLFFQATTAHGFASLAVLKGGFVLVGTVPTVDGTTGTVQPGMLLILDRNGNRVGQINDPTMINGPWSMAVNDQGNLAQVFVSNVLTGTVVRLDLRVRARGIRVLNTVQIATGYAQASEANALALGPAGLAYDATINTLYVASTADNAIYAISRASKRFSAVALGRVVYADAGHLRGPLGLVLLPNGNLLTVNGDSVNGDFTQPSQMVEFTPRGEFVAQQSLDVGGQGAGFGLAIATKRHRLTFAAVDSIATVLKLWQVTI